ncbi:hypothetical protein [Enterobacter roggenkampii]|uniref:hypothetical protein n=1 Tax=Enterobacter roggenkampii TaxID=1812935 RepID=UPI002075E489|nr:hypothetical protein [Enterobacter roggenkampii]MCM7083351.1 hypothetical protein [Enterobacter roggenkampii]
MLTIEQLRRQIRANLAPMDETPSDYREPTPAELKASYEAFWRKIERNPPTGRRERVKSRGNDDRAEDPLIDKDPKPKPAPVRKKMPTLAEEHARQQRRTAEEQARQQQQAERAAQATQEARQQLERFNHARDTLAERVSVRRTPCGLLVELRKRQGHKPLTPDTLRILAAGAGVDEATARHVLDSIAIEYRRSQLQDRRFVLAKFEAVHGNVYDYSRVDYRGASVPVVIGCRIHGDFKQKPIAHQQGKGCPKCGNAAKGASLRRTTHTARARKFFAKVRQVHGDRYDYSRAVYVNAHTKITIGCPVHGDFEQEPQHHATGHGCRQCRDEKFLARGEATRFKPGELQLTAYNMPRA